MSTISVAWISENPKRSRLEGVDRRAAVRRRADGGDDLVDQVECPKEALDDVGPSRALSRRNSERRVITSTWWAM